jgi:hypothetical protein
MALVISTAALTMKSKMAEIEIAQNKIFFKKSMQYRRKSQFLSGSCPKRY